MITFDRRNVNLRALNSLTKYPSIPTYHELDPRTGGLSEVMNVAFAGKTIGTEKVDGTNARIILLPPDDGGYLLGSRENLLYANGDLIGDPSQGIVQHLRAVADNMPSLDGYGKGDTAFVYYLELYGGKIGGQAKNYSTQGAVGWRLFDVATIDNLGEKSTWTPERISAWRDNGGQQFADEETLQADAHWAGLELTPRLFTTFGSMLPQTVQGMHQLLVNHLPRTKVALDESGKGAAEGIVLRTKDRSVIAKARFQDYERTLKRRGRS